MFHQQSVQGHNSVARDDRVPPIANHLAVLSRSGSRAPHMYSCCCSACTTPVICLRLRLDIDEEGASIYDIENTDRTFKARGTLTQLHTLTTNLMYDEADLATLHRLTEMR